MMEEHRTANRSVFAEYLSGGEPKVLLLTLRGICPCVVNEGFLRFQQLFIRLSVTGCQNALVEVEMTAWV